MLNHDSLLFSPTRDGVPSSDDNFMASDLIAAQDAMEAEARDVLPFAFDSCTYDLGYLKQPVYACSTCLNSSGVCAGCSIACHGEHELHELFNRRDFRCDCGTSRMGAGSCCTITKRDDALPNSENKYDRAFEGSFCICGVDYNPQTETDSMYQCLVCEDWLHHACLFGSHSDSNASPLHSDDFDLLICERCVKGNARVRRLFDRWAGCEGSGIMIIAKDDTVLGTATLEDDEDNEEEQVGTGAVVGEKRKTEDDDAVASTSASTSVSQEPATKRFKEEDGSSSSIGSSLASLDSTSTTTSRTTLASSQSDDKGCSAPPLPVDGVSPLARVMAEGGRGNMYLGDGWMERWCRCDRCLPLFDHMPYLLEEEELYEPPQDTEQKSTLELGMEALSKMPREQAIEGALAFQGLSERLKAYLQPYADAKKTVTKELVEEFFAREKMKLEDGRRH